MMHYSCDKKLGGVDKGCPTKAHQQCRLVLWVMIICRRLVAVNSRFTKEEKPPIHVFVLLLSFIHAETP